MSRLPFPHPQVATEQNNQPNDETPEQIFFEITVGGYDTTKIVAKERHCCPGISIDASIGLFKLSPFAEKIPVAFGNSAEGVCWFKCLKCHTVRDGV